ncbi:MAG TPA: glycoside hydrolase family 127 protein, partial [Telluria sp.]|nr:glycoside hydrolase family 127 protein [Telluria sp.]
MMRALFLAAALACGAAQAVELFPLQDVRLHAGPFLDAQQTDLRYLLALDPDRLAAPFLREAGLAPRKPSYGNWESSGLDGHMGGHYLSALALMSAATGDPEVRRRLDYFVAELKRAQDANGDGYLGGIPGGRAAWAELHAGRLRVDNFSVNGKWVPWYNLHKTFAGLRDAWLYAGNADARAMLVKLADWTLALTAPLSEAQMQDMLRAEQGGMNEVLADVSRITGDGKYLELARRFSHRALLEPLQAGLDRLDSLHANTQIPKVIGFERIGELTGDDGWRRAARFFWQTVVEHRTVAIGGNSVKEHFHAADDFRSMIEEVEGPETCNTYNMLKLTAMLFQRAPSAGYADYYERALYNHILASERPGSGGFVYFTPMRPNQYRVYSQVDQAMWCCVGSGIESHAKYGEFIYAHDGDRVLYVNLYAPSELRWRGLRIEQQTGFPDSEQVRIRVGGTGRFTLKLRRPAWVAAGAMRVRVNGRPVPVRAGQDGYVSVERAWRGGDSVELRLPMRLRLEQMPDRSSYYAVLYGPIVLAARSRVFADEKLNVFADDSRMGHIPQG